MVTIGKITKVLGLKGEVIVLPLTSFIERFEGLEKVFVGEEEKEIEYIKISPQRIVFKFRGISDRTKAELFLKGKELKVKDEDRFKPPEDYFYIDDLLNLEVFDEELGYIGVIKDVILSSQDLLVVETPEGKEVLIPFTKEICISLNLKEKRVFTRLPEGLLSL